jgi:hypothetical protein
MADLRTAPPNIRHRFAENVTQSSSLVQPSSIFKRNKMKIIDVSLHCCTGTYAQLALSETEFVVMSN